jgi:putative transposase
MMFPLVRDLAAAGLPVAVTCRVLGFSKQAFCAWKKQPVSRRDWDQAHLISAAIDIHRADPPFGYRLIADELAARGITASQNRVARLCSQQRIWPVFARKRGAGRKAGPPVHDDLVRRPFTAPRPDQLWLTGITEHPTGEGKLCLCAVKDACTGRIVGCPMDSRMESALAITALRNAIALRAPAAGTIVHPDRGSQFRSGAFTGLLRQHGRARSTGRAGPAPAAATRPWSRSPPCCRTMSWTAAAGPPATSCAWRSSPGSSAPATAGAASAASES